MFFENFILKFCMFWCRELICFFVIWNIIEESFIYNYFLVMNKVFFMLLGIYYVIILFLRDRLLIKN